MHYLILAALLTMTSCFSLATYASERPDHFKGEPAETMEQALANFSEYNARLAALLEQDELTMADLAQIHQLTYTLENALERINDDLEDLAETLETLHLSSETADIEAARNNAEIYLNDARRFHLGDL